jgi:hypothetical protein
MRRWMAPWFPNDAPLRELEKEGELASQNGFDCGNGVPLVGGHGR